MGVYKYDDPETGIGYDLNIAGDTPTNEEFAKLAGVLQRDRADFARRYTERFGEYEAPDDGSAIGRGYERGKQQVKGAFGETLGTLGEELGIDFLANYGLGVEKAAQQRQGELMLEQPQRMQSTDVKDISSGLTYAGEIVGEQIPQLGLGLTAAAATPIIAGASGVAATGIGIGAAALATAPILFGNNIQRQEDEVAAGRKDTVDVTDALIATFGQATLEGISDKLLLGGIFKPVGKNLFTRTVSRFGGGASTEALTEVGQQMMERAQAGLPIDSEDAIAEYREAAIAGGLIGGGVRSTIGAFDGRTQADQDGQGGVDGGVAAEAAGQNLPQLQEGQTQGELFSFDELPTTAPALREGQVQGELFPTDGTEQAVPETTTSEQIEFDFNKPDQPDLFTPKKVTKELLDDLGVFSRAPMRKTIEGKDLTDPEVQKKLRNYARNTVIKNKVPELESRVDELLGGLDGTRAGSQPTGTGASTRGSEPSVDGSRGGRSAVEDTREPATPDAGPVGDGVLATDGADATAGVQRDTLAEEIEPEKIEQLSQDVEQATATPVEAPTQPALTPQAAEAQKKAAERKRVRETPGAYTEMVRNALAETGTRTPAEVLVEPDEIAARRATLAQATPADVSTPAGPMTGAIGGAETGTAGQNIPAPVQVPAAPTLQGAPVPQEQLQAVEAQRNAAAQAGIDRIWNYNRESQIAIREFHDTQIDPRSAPEVTTAVDKEGILELIKTPDAQLENNAPAQAAKLFFKRFRRPVDALAEIGATRADGPVQQSLEGEKVSGGKTASKKERASSRFFYGPKEFKYYEGMTQPAAIQANIWVNNNLSRQARDEVRRAKIAARVDPKDNRSDAYLTVVNAAKAIIESDAKKVRKSLSRQEKGTTEAARKSEVQKQLEKQTELPLSLVAPAPIRLSSGQEIYRVTPAKKGLSTIEAVLTEQGFKRRKVRKNETVSEDTYTLLDEVDGAEVLYVYQDTRNDNELLTKEYHKEVVDDLEYSLENYGLLLADPVKGLDQKLLPSIRNALQRGDLQFVLNAISATSNVKRIRQIAAKLATVVGTTKVQVVDDLSQMTGRTAAGMFEPETNTIFIDANNGMNVHTILHEMTHAATAKSLANKALPEVQQLTSLFNTVREQFGEVYGTRNLDEFVAEAFGNPTFQRALALTRVDGGSKTAWEKFVGAIGRVVRKLLGMDPAPSALSEVDRLVEGMLSPAPETRSAPRIMLLSATRAGAEKLATTAAKMAPETSSKIADLQDVLVNETVAPKVKGFILDTLPVNILTDLAQKYIPFAKELNIIINRMSGALRGKSEMLDSMLGELQTWQRKNPEFARILNNTIPRSTYLQIDPSRTDAKYMKKINESKETQQEYKQLRDEYLKMDIKGQQLYQQLRNYFQDTYDDIIAALEARLDATIPDAELKRNAFEQLRKMLQKDSGVIRPYFPLMRKGGYRLSYTAADPETGQMELFVEYYPTQRKAVQAQAKVIDVDPTAEISNASQTMRLTKERVGTGFVRDMLQTVQFNQDKFNTDENYRKVMQELVDLALDAMPERSFMQNFRRRKGVRGFIGDTTPTGMGGMDFDAATMLKEKGRDLNRQLVQIRFAAELQRFRNKLQPYETTVGPAAQMAQKMDKMAEFAQSPNVPRASQIVNSLGFSMTMGLNFSSAAITFFDVAMSAMPILAGRHKLGPTAKAYRMATKMLIGSPTTRTVMVPGPGGKPVAQVVNMGVAGKTIANYSAAELLNKFGADTRMDILVKMGLNQGQFNQSLTQEQLEVGRDAPLETLNKYSSFMFHHSERFNRETTLAAAYMLEVQKLQKEKGQLTEADYTAAAQNAIDTTEFTLGGTAAAGRPIMAQTGIGNVLFLFKRFAISKYYMMAALAKDAANHPDLATRKAARAGMRNFLISTGLLAGAGGMPMMGAIGALYDLFADDDEDDFDTALRQFVGEGIYGGLANEILGIDVASRISMNSLLYRAPIIDKDQSALWTLLEQLGGPVIGVGLSMERGVKDMAEGEIWRGVEAMSPAAIRNGLKMIRFSTDGALTRRGDAIIEDINPYNVVMQGLGFAPQAYIQQMDANKNARRREDAIDSKRGKLLRRRNMAIREGDQEELQRVEKLIDEFNASLPDDIDVRKKRITGETKSRSLKSFKQTSTEMRGGITTTETSRSILEQYDFE